MDIAVRFYIYLLVIMLSIITSILQYRYLDRASRILMVLLIITAASEIFAHMAAVTLGNNMFVYHFFAPVQLCFIGLYFNQNVAAFKRYNIGIWVGAMGVLMAALNAIYLQPLEKLNSHFLLFEGLCIMGMAGYSFVDILKRDDVHAYRYPHFWFSFILLFFWSVTYTNWALYSLVRVKIMFTVPYILVALWIINIITYLGIALVFLFYPKNELR